jgi:dienelactone hydrolase
MHHETLEYFDAQQRLLGELIYDKRHEDSKKRPAIIVFPAFEGRNQFAINYAENLAKRGYVTFAADMYGDAMVARDLEKCFQYIAPFLQDRSLVRRRAQLAFQTVAALPMVDKNKIGALGFCFGGMCILELARSGENLAAGVSMHGVLKKSNLPTAAQIKTKFLILQGYRDPQISPDSLREFAEEMTAAGDPDWVYTFFSHAKHSFTEPKVGTMDPKRESEMGREYNPIAAKRSLAFALDFFGELLD